MHSKKRKTSQKKIKQTKKDNTLVEHKNIIIWLVIIFLAVIAIIWDTKSVFGYHLFSTLHYIFWDYYKIIFSPVLILLWSLMIFKEDIYKFSITRILWLLLFYLSITTIIGMIVGYTYTWFFNFYPTLKGILGSITTLLLFIIIFIISTIILFRFSYKNAIIKIKNKVSDIGTITYNWIVSREDEREEIIETKQTTKKNDLLSEKHEEIKNMMEELKREKEKLNLEKEKLQKESFQWTQKIEIEKKAPKTSLVSSFFNKSSSQNNEEEKYLNDEKSHKHKEESKSSIEPDYSNWVLPNIDLLESRWWEIEYDERDILQKQLEIQEKLMQFKIEVKMQWYRVWPTVIQYRLYPKEWVKLNKIENLKKDIALALKAKSIRIQAPIPGEWVVGIEVPNENRQVVGLREIIESPKFNSDKIEIPLALGKDVNGDVVIWDMTKMPHLLIAGQTGSGKSVGMNWFLISLLYKFSPSELKIIMVDPKMVELSIYNWIPHLLTPVITNADKALNALKWAVAEMLRRYDLEKELRVRNIKEYNAKVNKSERLPYIVIVVDELADLMMSGNKKEVESSIARIAQMARAVGMHLIIATQRPSVDVITGLIKANIPSRVAFTVASQIDSRTVIDRAGAEDLLGRWDMLYFPTGAVAAERVQWVLVETDEVESVVNHAKLTIDPNMVENLYDKTIADWKSNLEWSVLEWYGWDQDENPEIIEKAIQIVKESKKWSTSLIQRKLGLGYARAAKVLDILEDLGVVWPANGSKPREVYVD